jgi:hypothetical protein
MNLLIYLRSLKALLEEFLSKSQVNFAISKMKRVFSIIMESFSQLCLQPVIFVIVLAADFAVSITIVANVSQQFAVPARIHILNAVYVPAVIVKVVIMNLLLVTDVVR